MVLNQLKQIRDELKASADKYDRAFKKTALIAAQELTEQERNIVNEQHQSSLNVSNSKAIVLSSNNSLNKQYFIKKYGSLKNAKAAYQKRYGKQKYGRSWSDFISVAQKISDSNSQKLSLEDRIAKIENFLVILGYQL
jgi:hypothetical protein